MACNTIVWQPSKFKNEIFEGRSKVFRYYTTHCDATARILTQGTVDLLAQHVPESTGTQLYLQASVWIHEPFRNSAFGDPTKVVQSLWAGIMTWRRWRKYIRIVDGLVLGSNFISYSHYITLELLVHAGIIHQLTLFFALPHLDPSRDYAMRNTGNHGLEAIHSIFRGGLSSLPITAPNLSFQEFLN